MIHATKKQRSGDGCSVSAAFHHGGIASPSVDSLQKSNMVLNGIVRLNVGGKIYMTMYRTLTNHQGSKLEAFFTQFFSQISRSLPVNLVSEGIVNTTGNSDAMYPTVFIDRDGDRFSHILNYLRDGDSAIPEDASIRRDLVHEARFYGLSHLENKLRSLVDVDCCGMQTPKATIKCDSSQNSFVGMNVEGLPTIIEPSPAPVLAQCNTCSKPLGRMTSITNVSALGNNYEDTQSYVNSQHSADEDIFSSQKSLLHMFDNDNIEESGVFFQTTPLSQMGKAEFCTTVEF